MIFNNYMRFSRNPNIKTESNLINKVIVHWDFFLKTQKLPLFQPISYFIIPTSNTFFQNDCISTLNWSIKILNFHPFEIFCKKLLNTGSPKTWKLLFNWLTNFFIITQFPSTIVSLKISFSGKYANYGDARKTKQSFQNTPQYKPNHPRFGTLLQYSYITHFFLIRNVTGVTNISCYIKYNH